MWYGSIWELFYGIQFFTTRFLLIPILICGQVGLIVSQSIIGYEFHSLFMFLSIIFQSESKQ